MLRRALAAAVLAAAITVIVPSTPAHALYPCPANTMCLHTWYADSARTIWKGSYSINCDAQVLRLGTQSGYLVFTTEPCGGGTPPPIG